MRIRPAAALAAALALGLRAAAAVAGDAADDKFREGEELFFKAGHATGKTARRALLGKAVGALEESFGLAPTASGALTIADVYRFIAEEEEPSRADGLFRLSFNWMDRALGLKTNPKDLDTAADLRKKLEHVVAVINVTVEPQDAELWLDGQSLGTRRSVAVLPNDAHVVLLRHAGYRDAEARVSVRIGESAPVAQKLARLEGQVRVESEPPGAKIRLEPGGDVGVAPGTLPLPVGSARLVASLPGFVDQAHEVVVSEGAEVHVTFTLARAPGTVAALTVQGSPAGATVRLHDRDLGALPLSLSDVAPGRGEVEIAAPGFGSWRGEVPLEAGSATRIEVQLAPPPSPHRRTWKWVGIGGGAALFAVGAVVGLVAQSEKNAFFDNPSSSRLESVNDRWNPIADIAMGVGLAALAATAAWWILSGPPPASSARVTVR